MKPLRIGGVAVALAAVVGCAPPVDVNAEREALLAADRAWAEAAASRDVERIVSYWTDDARLYNPGEPPYQGKEALREMVADGMDTPGFSITWEAEDAVVASSGDMGYTFGRNTLTVPGPDGALMTIHGRYVTVWHKQPDGTWRCAIDIFNAGPGEGG
ncbi:MAG: DUF4440 domain-containing protein [Gemmatimonadales bacterium]|jgi:ketosteroid isomerase-like protein